MRAVLIDAENMEVRTVDYTGDYRDIYKLIGCDTFTTVTLENGDSIFVDDDGMYTQTHVFNLKEFHQPLFGNGLVLGCDEEGESISPKLTYTEVANMIESWGSVLRN